MTTNGVPADPIVNPATQTTPLDIQSFMEGPMPTPSDVERAGAVNAQQVVAEPPVAPPVSPAPPIQQPQVQQPQVAQPAPEQPTVPQPAPQQPDLQQQFNDLNAQFQQRETLYEQQRQEIADQQQQAQIQQITNGAEQYGMQQYQKYLAAGNTDEVSRQWARSDAQFAYQAAGTGLQSQQVNTQAQTIAKQYGINPQDLQTIHPSSMDAHAQLLQRLNRVEAGNQQVTQNQVTQQQFDSGVGVAAGADPTEAFIRQLGDPTKKPAPGQLQAWATFMDQNLRR